MITIKEISYELARQAFLGISFTPEKRADSVIGTYKESCNASKKNLKIKGLWKEEYADIIQSCFDKKHELCVNWLRKLSQCMSTMITGPANFPVARNRKKLDSEQKANEALCQFSISIEVAKRIRKRQRNQEVAARVDSGGFETTTLFEKPGIKVVNNKALERVQIVFDNKPSAEIRDKLKDQAFRWSPKNNAWQRKNTKNGLRAAEFVFEEIAKLDDITGKEKS